MRERRPAVYGLRDVESLEGNVGRARRHTEITRTPRDAGDQLTLVVKRYDNKLWEVNGEPCDSALIAARVLLECLETLDRRPSASA